MWRDADTVMRSISATLRDIMLVTMAAGTRAGGGALRGLPRRPRQAVAPARPAHGGHPPRRADRQAEPRHDRRAPCRARSRWPDRRATTSASRSSTSTTSGLFNDTHGHDAADEVLLRVAELLQRESASTDLVGRYGPDEFLLVRPGAGVAEMEESVDSPASRALGRERAVRRVRALPVSVSVGICRLPRPRRHR